MVIDKQEHKDFLIDAIKSIQFTGNLEQISEVARIGQEVLQAIQNAEISQGSKQHPTK